ncbi:MAG: hypothetical protein GY906_24765 [bacterium]|nr:hypothetical protein [bacterium]
MNAKAKGARSERKVRAQLEADGWHVVKSGGSLGLWDLVALHPTGKVRLVQVKTNRKPPKKEMKKLSEFAERWWGTECLIAVVYDRNPTKWTILNPYDN